MPYLQMIDKAGKACQGQTLQLIQPLHQRQRKKVFIKSSPGLCPAGAHLRPTCRPAQESSCPSCPEDRPKTVVARQAEETRQPASPWQAGGNSIINGSFPLSKVTAITSTIMPATATHIVLTLAQGYKQKQSYLCHVAQGGQVKYNMCRCCQHYRRRYRINFRQWKHGLKATAIIALCQCLLKHIKIFSTFKKGPSLERFMPQCKYH